MRKSTLESLLFVLLATGLLTGCQSRREFFDPACSEHFQAVATALEEPNTCVEPRQDLLTAQRPYTLRGTQPTVEWPLRLEEAIQIALTNSEIIRDIGGRVLTASTFGGTNNFTVYDVALSQANPLIGQEAALSAFDAQFQTSLRFNRNQRTLNNFFFGGGVSGLRQNTSNFLVQVNKTAATGTQFALRNYVNYDRNNSPANRFHSVYDSILEGEIRQPLLQGAGIEFNRIAGPNSSPGVYTGVLLARINTDVAQTTFEQSTRDLLMSVEQAYWNLYFAYRDLDAKVARRDALREAWRVLNEGVKVGESLKLDEALAREEYYQARAEVEDALSGTATSGLSVTTSAGVYTVERRLRQLLGLPANDGRLIRPADEPSLADVVFDWDDSVLSASTRRVELRRQKFNIKRRELELMAARNFLKMRFDFLGQYRWRGFGDELLSDTNVQNGSAYEDLLGGQLTEWQMGLQLSAPIGNRIGHTAVRFAELQLARERSVYREQELQVLHDLSAAFAEVDRAYSVTRSYYNRRVAAYQRLEPLKEREASGLDLLREFFEAQRRASEATSTYYRGLVDYNLAVTNLHLQRGTLLEYMGVRLTEGPWTPDAYNSAAKQARRFRTRHFDYAMNVPGDITEGPVNQNLASEAAPGELLDGEGNLLPQQGQPPFGQPQLAQPQPEQVLPLEQMNDGAELDQQLPGTVPRLNSQPQPNRLLNPEGGAMPLQKTLPPHEDPEQRLSPPKAIPEFDFFEPDSPENSSDAVPKKSAYRAQPMRVSARPTRPQQR